MSSRLEGAVPFDASPTLLAGDTGRRVIGGLLVLVLLILVASALWVSQRALNAFDELLLPEFDRDAELIAARLASDLDRASRLGIGAGDLRDVEPFLETYLGEHPALVYLAIGDSDGRLIAAVGPAAAELGTLPTASLRPSAGQTLETTTDDTARRTTARVGAVEGAYAHVHVGMDRQFAEAQIADIRWDIVVVLVVSLLVTFELLIFVIDRTMTTPLRLIDRAMARAMAGEWSLGGSRRRATDEVGHLLGAMDATGRRIQGRLAELEAKLATLRRVPEDLMREVEALRRRVRPSVDTEGDRPVESRANARFTLFLFVFAEELSRSFLPLYAESILVPVEQLGPFGRLLEGLGLAVLLTPQVIIGLPIIVFMAVMAIATPFGGSLVARYGSRTIFLVGVVPAVAGYVGTALAYSVFDMLIWRSFSAVGYALVTIACQGYLADLTAGSSGGGAGGRARNMAVFVAAVTTAVICGSAIGAVFADRLGYRVTFLISAGFVLLAGLLASRYLESPAVDRPRRTASAHGQFRAFANPRFLFLIVLAAIPAKVALTGFLFYTTPVFLASLDVSQPAIGRMIMLYGLLMLVGTQLGARLHDRVGGGIALIALGGLLTGAALSLPQIFGPALGMALAIAGFGLAQGLAAAPMLAVLPELCPVESQRYGATGLAALLRLAERVGSVLGPLIAAALALRFGYGDAIAFIGLFSAVTALAFVALLLGSTSGGGSGLGKRLMGRRA